jgi:3',5'-cyclic AMP phosphodiesterase CpdA
MRTVDGKNDETNLPFVPKFMMRSTSRADFLRLGGRCIAGSVLTFGLLNSLSGCASEPTAYAERTGAGVLTTGPGGKAAAPIATAPHYPEVTFMVFSDTHLYDGTLGTSGTAWVDYMANDRKLLKDSEETLRVSFEKVKLEKPTFVLISGDLTKDGERQCHEKLVSYLRELADLGIAVYVIPGNHDVNNTDAARFLPSGEKMKIPTVSPKEFASLYEDFGYGKALYRDPASLSYVAEPVPGLWILALDSVKYEDNFRLNTPVTSGRIRNATMPWIEARLIEAEQKGKAVIAMEHHPIMEHYDGMKAKYPEYVVDDNWKIASLLASHDVSLVFTGHFHASSIVQHRWNESAAATLQGKSIIDVETGSLVTWPCSYRSVKLSGDGTVRITTYRVDQLPSYAAVSRSFDIDGKSIIEEGIRNIATSAMKNLGVPEEDRNILSSQIVDAMMAHYAGDAHFTGSEMLRKHGLSLMGQLVVASYDHFIQGLWKVRAPANVELMEDNNLVIAPDGRLAIFLSSVLAMGKDFPLVV